MYLACSICLNEHHAHNLILNHSTPTALFVCIKVSAEGYKGKSVISALAGDLQYTQKYSHLFSITFSYSTGKKQSYHRKKKLRYHT